MSAFLYVLQFPNGKAYVGLTRQQPPQRLRKHVSSARAGSPLLVHRAIRQYGEPRMVVLMEDDLDTIAMLEVEMIQEFHTLAPYGYNLDRGGRYRSMTESQRAAVSERVKRQDLSYLRTPGVRARQAAAMREAWTRPGYREAVGEKITAANTGRRLSAETRRRQSEAAKRRHANTTPEQRKIASEKGRAAALRRWRK